MTDDEISSILYEAGHNPYEVDIFRLGMEAAAKVCERDLVNRRDDPLANSFDGGLRHCAAAIKSKAKGER